MEFSAASYWQKSIGLEAKFPALSGKETADILIVGGGLLGMWTALEIKKEQPDRKVVIIEAYYCGFGPSGRNGGIVYDYWTSLPELTSKMGYDKALKLARFSERAVSEIKEDLQNIDFRESGVLHISTTPLHDHRADKKIKALRAAQRNDLFEELSAEEVGERVVSPRFRGGVFYPKVSTLDPGKLVYALRNLLSEIGVIIYENTLLVGLSGDDAFMAKTEDGLILADQVLLSTGSTGKFIPKKNITVASSNMVVTRPIENIDNFWQSDAAITDERDSVKYMQKTPDKRIAFGWGRGTIGSRLLQDVEEQEIRASARALLDFFPEISSEDIEFGWGGPVDISATHMPFVINPKKNLWLAAGFTGSGLGGTKTVSKMIAPRMLGIATPDLTISLPKVQDLPPEVIKNIGGQIVREALLRKEKDEEAGNTPSSLDKFISSLPSKMGIRIGR